MEIRIIRCDDWCWIYIEGKICDSEGSHDIEHEDLVRNINYYLEKSRRYIGKIYLQTWWISDEYAEMGCPDLLKNIPESAYL